MKEGGGGDNPIALIKKGEAAPAADAPQFVMFYSASSPHMPIKTRPNGR